LRQRCCAATPTGGAPQAWGDSRPVVDRRASACDHSGPQRALRKSSCIAGSELHVTDRGGDVTYHGPGQIVGYPILDLREWKRDVGAYLRALEQVLIDALGEFRIAAGRRSGATGVWTGDAKIAAIGVHISRWVTSHGFALNVDTDLSYFKYIVPCGLTLPVTSMRALGSAASRQEVVAAIAGAFARVFGRAAIAR